METDPQTIPNREGPGHPDALEMPEPTVAPLVLALGLSLLAVGVVSSPAFLVVGAVVLVTGLGLWVSQLLPGRGHFHEPFVPPALRAGAVTGRPGMVEQLGPGMPGYRLRMPAQVHPISAGIKGGILGGIVMTIPPSLYGLLSGHGIWYPANLLTGMVLPGVGGMSVAELERFHPTLLALAILIHVVNSVIFGMCYGVLLPTLPHVPRPLAWGGLLIPLFWTAVSFGALSTFNAPLSKGLDWPSFIASQFVFGVVAALSIMRTGDLRPLPAGLTAGAVGGLLMPIPAILWGLWSGYGIWYPANVLVGMVRPGLDKLPAEELMRFHADWLAIAIAIHLAMSFGIGLLFAVLLPRLGRIPSPLVWGGALMPLLWTAVTFGLMGVVNPLLQERVDWPWFVVSQFVFGVVAAIVVDRSEEVEIPPAGGGPDRLETFIDGSGGGQS